MIPGGPRRWQIECGLATVEVVGTSSAARGPHGLRVGVERGVVLVRGERVVNHVRRLTAGESMEILDETAGPAAGTSAPGEGAAATCAGRGGSTGAGRKRRRPRAAGPTWRELARSGRHREAFATLGAQGIRREVKRLGIADLFALADVARLSGHPAEAVAPLQRIVDGFAADRAGAAGRVRARPPAARRPRPAARGGRLFQPRAGAGRAPELARRRPDPARRGAGAHSQRRAIGIHWRASADVRPPQGNCCARADPRRADHGARRRPPRRSGCSRPSAQSGPVSSDDFIDALRVELAGRQPHCCVVGPGGDAAATRSR